VEPDHPGLRLRSDEQNFTARDAKNSIVGYCSFGNLNGFGELPQFGPPEYVGVAAGLNPAMLDRGNGRSFMTAILELGRRLFPDRTIVGLVKNANRRSKKSVLAAGFVVHSEDPWGEGVIVVDGMRPYKAEARTLVRKCGQGPADGRMELAHLRQPG